MPKNYSPIMSQMIKVVQFMIIQSAMQFNENQNTKKKKKKKKKKIKK